VSAASAKTAQKKEPRTARARKLEGQTNIWIGALLIIAIALMVNFLSYRHFERWDWTTESIYSLSDRSKAELASLADPVTFYLFMGQGEAHYVAMHELLERYRSESPNFRVEYVDPHGDPERYRELARRFDVMTLTDATGAAEADVAAIVAMGERTATIERTDLISLDWDLPDDETSAKIDVRAEQAITGALVELTTEEETRVCVTQGHGEWAVEGGNARSLYAAEDVFRRDRIELAAVRLDGDGIDPACDALFVIGPQVAFRPEEMAKIERYLEQGGNALFAFDPVAEDRQFLPTGAEAFLGDLGIEVTRSLVIETDPNRNAPQGGTVIGGDETSYGQHETTAPLVTQPAPAIFFELRGLVAKEGSPASPLLFTSESSWAETNFDELIGREEVGPDGDDPTGPVSIAIATTVRERAEGEAGEAVGGRVIVVGDADWLTGDALRSPAFLNDDLLRVWTGWLAARHTLVSISPRQADATPMFITEENLGFGFSGLGLKLLVIIPFAFVLFGVGMWWTRRT
jgi:ABC-2 type transport system permease protein